MLAALLLLSSALPQGGDPLPPHAPAILSSTDRVLPALGLTLRDLRSLDPATGGIRRQTSDAATGRPVDGDALLLAEARARDEAHGKIAPVLRAKLGQLAEPEVVFWLRRPGTHPDLRAVLDAALAAGADSEAARRHALAVAAEHSAPLTAPLAAALRAAGHTVVYVDAHVPLVFARLPAAAVAAFAARADVDQAYYSFPTWMSETLGTGGIGRARVLPVFFNDKASPSARTDAVHRRGITGAGVKVLVQDTAPCTTVNPSLPTVVQRNGGTPATHATAVAGIIASTHPTYHGAAPGLGTIYDAGGSGDVRAPQNWSWGMQQGIAFGNCSWWNGNRGSIAFLDRYFDYIIRNFAVMMFKSIGNQGLGQPTTTPGNGYNVTGSGCFEDRDTVDWGDDRMASFSSTRNPSPGHEKPEVSAPGSGIYSTTPSSPWVGGVGSGTSFASPVTCGVAALLAQTDKQLLAKPELVKAMLMAGAWNNIEGSAVLSDQDGAGGIDAAASWSAVAGQRFTTAMLTPASFANGIWSRVIPLAAGDETRIVGLWFSSADSSYATDTLQMDLDMTVEDPTGKVVASSASSLNPFEIVMFTPATSGNFTVKMHRQRFQGTAEPFALAWTTAQDLATDTVTLSATPRLGTTIRFDFRDPYNPGKGYFGILSGSGAPAVLPLSATRMLPMALDIASDFGFGLPGFIGFLDAQGRASGQLAIPDVQGLRGIRLHYAMVTWDVNVANGVRETSPVESFVLQ